MKMSEALWKLISECVMSDVGIEINYDTGRYIPGEFWTGDPEKDKEHLMQGPRGFTIEVGGLSPDRGDGQSTVYPATPDGVTAMIQAGFQALQKVLQQLEDSQPHDNHPGGNGHTSPM